MINSIPYHKDWLDDHSQRANPNAPLICGFGKSLERFIKVTSMSDVYLSDPVLYVMMER